MLVRPCYLCLTLILLLAVTALGASVTTAPATWPAQSDGSIPFAPFLGIGVVIFILGLLAACLLLLGLGIAVGIAICAMVGILAVVGIISTSVVIGFLRRSAASGLRVFFLQAGALAGIPCGMAAMWLVMWWRQIHWKVESILIIGGICGAVEGAAIALLFNQAWKVFTAWWLKRLAGQ